VTLTDYLRLKEEKQELEYLWDINEELKEENRKLKEQIDKLLNHKQVEWGVDILTRR
jgi:cell division protein FtsB